MGVKTALMRLLPQIHYSVWSLIFLLGLAAAGLVIFFKNKPSDQAIRYAFILTGLLIVLMPASLHPWYVIMLIPFLCFYPTVAWLLFSCMVTLSYLKYIAPSGIMPTWILLLEYGLLLALLAGGLIARWINAKKQGTAATPGQKDAYFLARL